MNGFRRRRGVATQLAAADPGKDLFAYLFLLIMVFSFMLLMSVDQRKSIQDAPQSRKTGMASFVQVDKSKLATLEKQGSKIVLKIGNDLFDPRTDVDRLIRENKVVTVPDGSTEKQVLYVKKPDADQITLHDYLETFQHLSKRKITIIFAAEVG